MAQRAGIISFNTFVSHLLNTLISGPVLTSSSFGKCIHILFVGVKGNLYLIQDIPEILVEHVREALARNISRQYQTDEGTIPVMTLDQEIENRMSESIQETSQGSYLGIDPEMGQAIIAAIENGLDAFAMFNYQPLILCSPMVRPHLKRLTERTIPGLAILSHSEISLDVRIESLGTISLYDEVAATADMM